MVGRELAPVTRAAAAAESAARLELRALSSLPEDPFGTPLRDITFSVHGGEVVGVAGVSGNGQRELLQMLCGERRCTAREVLLDASPVGNLGVAARRARGMAFVPEDRHGTGAVSSLSLADNALLTAHPLGLTRHGLIRRARLGRFTQAIIDRFGVQLQRSARAGAHPLRRQSAEVHHGPGDEPCAPRADRRATHLGRRCRRRGLPAPEPDRPEPPRHGRAGVLGGDR